MKSYINSTLASLVLAGTLAYTSSDAADIAQKTRGYALNMTHKQSPNYTPGRAKNIEGIVIHSTEGSGQGALSWMTNPKSKVSAHYLVMENGQIYQLVQDNDKAWHAGRAANGTHLGIEFAGYAHKPGAKFSDAQYEYGGLLAAQLVKKHKLSPSNVVSHAWVSKHLGGTDHSDPGPNFDWVKFNRAMNKYMTNPIVVSCKPSQ